MPTKKILVAMSGGVDSSVAAVILKEQGYDLVGVTMNLACVTSSRAGGCCDAAAAADAGRVAKLIGMPHYVINLKANFMVKVIDNFIDEYKRGRTPNPCIRCNQLIKFGELLRKADELGAEFIATGHYAKIESRKSKVESGKQEYYLKKGTDTKKDQSYVLYRLGQKELARIMFPLGEMTKAEVRKKAKELGLPVADKEESQEICFIEDNDYGRYLKDQCPDAVKPGKIVDRSGKAVGEHQGIAFYTIGQRKGIGAHKGEPKYVVELRPGTNEVVIGDDADLMRKELIADDLSFVSGQLPATPLAVTAKIRYNSNEAEAELKIESGKRTAELGAQVLFKEPQRAVTPGQSVVFYQGEVVLGGGIISS